MAHGSVVISTVEVSTATASTRWEGRSAAAALVTATTFVAAAATTTLVAALVLRLSLLDVNAPSINLSNWIVLNKILCN